MVLERCWYGSFHISDDEEANALIALSISSTRLCGGKGDVGGDCYFSFVFIVFQIVQFIFPVFLVKFFKRIVNYIFYTR